MVKFFLIDRNNNLVINNEEIFNYKEFHQIYTSDRRADKQDAFKLFRYLYLMYDLQSSYYRDFIHDEEKRKQVVLKEVQLDAVFVNNDLIKQAGEKYTYLQKSPSVNLLNTTLKAFNSTIDTIEFLNDDVHIKIKKLKEMDSASLDVSTQVEYTALLKVILGNIKEIQSLSTLIPTQIDKFDNLLNKVKAELSNKKLAQGGREVGNREDADYMGRLGERAEELS